MNNRERLGVPNKNPCSDPVYERLPLGCESPNHATVSSAERPSLVICYGYLRKCPSCGRFVCPEDGAADNVDDALPGVCDTCFDGGMA